MDKLALNKFMAKNGLSKEAFAELMGVTNQAVYWWMTGQRSISRPVSRLCKLMEMYPQLIEVVRKMGGVKV